MLTFMHLLVIIELALLRLVAEVLIALGLEVVVRSVTVFTVMGVVIVVMFIVLKPIVIKEHILIVLA